MAVIDSKKLLPPAKSSGSALDKQKFLVPVSNIKVKSSAIVRGSDITSIKKIGDGGGEPIFNGIIQIRTDLVSIQKIIGDNNTLFKKSEERKRKLLEKEKFAKKEQQLEKKDPKQKTSLSIPSLPRTGFLDAIKRFLFYTLLGAAFVKFGKHIPKILEFSKKLIPAFKFVEDFAGNLLNGAIEFIDKGYKAYDKVREITKQVGGEDLQKKFDEFSKQFNTFANLAFIAGMSTMGGTDFTGGGGKPSTTKPGFDRVRGGRVDKPTQARYLSRYGKGAFTNRFGQQSLKNLTGKGVGKLAGRVLGRVPIIGGLVDFIISTVIFKEKPGRAAAKAVGATIGSALGTFIPVPFAGTILGGVVGDLVGGALYDSLVGNDTLKAKAQGGQVTRGGQRVSGQSRRSIKTVRTRPPKVKPQKTIPGKDVGGKEEIKKIFPSPANPNQRNPLGVLETTSKNLKEVPLLGGIMGASVDLAMGQKPDTSVFRKIGYGFGALVQNAIDAETSNTIGNIQKEIVGLAGGGAVPRTLSSNESVGMKIGERLGKTLEVMMNSKVTETLQSIRQQFGKEGFGFGPDGAGTAGELAGGEYGGFAPEGIQKEIYEYLINEKKMSDVQALGLMANISRESGFRPGVPSGDDGGAGGLFQWKIPRSTAMAKAVPDWKTNWKGQIDYALREPGEKGPQYLSTRFSSAQEAADWWMREWERPADKISASKKHAKYLSTVPKAPDGSVKFRAASSIVSSGNFDIVQYITGDVNYRGDGKQFYYDKGGHGMPGNYHDHIAFRTESEKERAKKALRAAGIKLGIEYRPGDPGYHGKNLAIDVPGSQWGGSGKIGQKEYFGSKKVREVLGLSAFEKGGKVHGFTRAILGEKGPEFVLDANTTAALEQTYPGFLDALNKADYKGSLQILSNYASYYNPSNSSTIMLQKVIVEKPVPMPMGSGGPVASIDNSGTTSPITASLYSA
jgi:hypothetical protein